MKIDKSNPLHWIWLALFSINTCLALFLRSFIPAEKRNTAILYGHKLSGNLKGIHDYTRQQSHPLANNLYYLTMDPAYYRELNKQGVKGILCGLNPLHMLKVARAFAIISDHGLHSLIILLKISNIRFIDVWHGIPFKGFDQHDFALQHQYDEIWVGSSFLRQLYIEKFGFDEKQVKVTGYARSDLLLNPSTEIEHIKTSLGIEKNKQVILFAPTWQQDSHKRSIYPFGLSEQDFLEQLDRLCQKNRAVLLFRKHLNNSSDHLPEYSSIIDASFQHYPDTEAVLLASDCLICDWSSIAFDYLLLDRPTIFLDVAPPFKKGFSLGPEFRFGAIATDMPQMLKQLQGALEQAGHYRDQHQEKHNSIRHLLYENMANGSAAKNCLERLEKLHK